MRKQFDLVVIGTGDAASLVAQECRLKQDLMKVSLSGKHLQGTSMTGNKTSAAVGASQMPKSA
jgi:hypothetical protein